MKQRIITAIVLVTFFTPLILFPDPVFNLLALVVFGGLNLMGVFELFRLYREKKYKSNKLLLLLMPLASINYLLVATMNPKANGYLYNTLGFNNMMLLLLLSMVCQLATICIAKFNNHREQKLLMQIILYPSNGFGMMMYLKYSGTKYLLLAILITSLTDTFALFMGKLFGKHKLAPVISPKKTTEGAILGTLVTTVFLLPIFFFYHKIFAHEKLSQVFNYDHGNILHFSPSLANAHWGFQLLVLFMIIVSLSFLGQIGDLYASKIKRDYKVKDYSHIFPGHGGVLDRFDSIIFVAFAFGILILLCRSL